MLTANAGEGIGFLPVSEWPLISLDLDVDLAWEGPDWTRDSALPLDRYCWEQGIVGKHFAITQLHKDDGQAKQSLLNGTLGLPNLKDCSQIMSAIF